MDLENKMITVHNNLTFVRDRSKDEKKYMLLEQDSVKTDAGGMAENFV